MIYSEASYFDGYHFQHIAAWEDERKHRRIERAMARARTTRPARTS